MSTKSKSTLEAGFLRSRQMKAFLSKGAILTWAGGGGGRPSLAPGEEWLLRISPPQNGGIGGTMAL